MTSFIWKRDPQEAYKNPYEYKAQDQFSREAKKLLALLFGNLIKYSGKYTRDERSVEKAVWMLSLDALESLKDCLELLRKKRHRIASRLIRDAVEVMDTASYFYSEDKKREKYLHDWYDDKVIPNRVYREYLANYVSVEESKRSLKYYNQLSKLNHRTYRSLAFSYTLGKEQKLIYEGQYENGLLVPPQTISMYYALLGDLITYYFSRLIEFNLITPDEANMIWETALEKRIVKRRFTPVEETFERFYSGADDIT